MKIEGLRILNLFSEDIEKCKVRFLMYLLINQGSKISLAEIIRTDIFFGHRCDSK